MKVLLKGIEADYVSMNLSSLIVDPKKERHSCFDLDRIFFKVIAGVIYKCDNKPDDIAYTRKKLDDIIEDIRPPQWYDFPKDSFTCNDILTMFSDLSNSGSEFINNHLTNDNTCEWTSEPLVFDEKDPTKDEPSYHKRIIWNYVNRNRKGVAVFSLRLENHVILRSVGYNTLARMRAQTIQNTLDDSVNFVTRFNLRENGNLSCVEWISKIDGTLRDYGIYLEKARLETLANTAMNRIQDKLLSKECKICLKQVEFRSAFKILQPCKHIFHRDCMKHCRLGDNKDCPICTPLLLL